MSQQKNKNNSKNNNNQNQSSRGLIIIFIIILLITILGVGGFLVYDKIIKSHQTITQSTPTSKSNTKKTDESEEEDEDKDGKSTKTQSDNPKTTKKIKQFQDQFKKLDCQKTKPQIKEPKLQELLEKIENFEVNEENLTENQTNLIEELKEVITTKVDELLIQIDSEINKTQNEITKTTTSLASDNERLNHLEKKLSENESLQERAKQKILELRGTDKDTEETKKMLREEIFKLEEEKAQLISEISVLKYQINNAVRLINQLNGHIELLINLKDQIIAIIKRRLGDLNKISDNSKELQDIQYNVFAEFRKVNRQIQIKNHLRTIYEGIKTDILTPIITEIQRIEELKRRDKQEAVERAKSSSDRVGPLVRWAIKWQWGVDLEKVAVKKEFDQLKSRRPESNKTFAQIYQESIGQTDLRSIIVTTLFKSDGSYKDGLTVDIIKTLIDRMNQDDDRIRDDLQNLKKEKDKMTEDIQESKTAQLQAKFVDKMIDTDVAAYSKIKDISSDYMEEIKKFSQNFKKDVESAEIPDLKNKKVTQILYKNAAIKEAEKDLLTLNDPIDAQVIDERERLINQQNKEASEEILNSELII